MTEIEVCLYYYASEAMTPDFITTIQLDAPHVEGLLKAAMVLAQREEVYCATVTVSTHGKATSSYAFLDIIFRAHDRLYYQQIRA